MLGLFCNPVLVVLSISNHLVEEERAGCFALIVIRLSVFCFCFSSFWCHGLVCGM